jgi:hypothetical protein
VSPPLEKKCTEETDKEGNIWLPQDICVPSTREVAVEKLIDHDGYMGVFPTQVEMLQLEIDDLRTMHSSHIHWHLFLGTPSTEKDKEECGRDGRIKKMQHTNIVTYFTIRSNKE